MHFTQVPGKFLIGITSQTELGFAGSDTRQQFIENLKTQPSDWHYRTKQITYKRNRNGYRTESFDQVDWNNSIVVFGCSCIFGVGLAEDETLSSQIQKISGIPTINMGIGGSSMFHSLYNQLCLRENEFRPVAIVNSWTNHDRMIRFADKTAVSLGPWSKDSLDGDFFKYWTGHDHNTPGYANLIRRSALMLSNGQPYYDFSFFEKTAEVLGVEYCKPIDAARDMLHPGFFTMQSTARKILSNLNL